MIKKPNGKQRKILNTNALNEQNVGFHFKMRDLNEIKQNNQTWGLGHFTRPLLCISPPNSPNKIIAISTIRVPEQQLHIQSNGTQNQTLTNIPCNCNRSNNATNKNGD
ncbi:MAG: hypothetical protein EZS28_027575 [Streblomastix strix]|uniref:Uncharacterized protein n=1 Tax=Streblomastix strix TaxID=222440 RepID=A0A5J4V3H4_9EUKA|nr:MAG: hypothetical protein EZS28_027575 [Streblomastix strix]